MIDQIATVARDHAPEGGYGETAYHAGDGTVYWVPADWSSNDEVEAAHAAFMQIDGVNGVVGDAESALPTEEGWTQVYPEPGSQEAYERVLALAMRPLVYAATVPARVHYRVADVRGQSCSTCANFVDGHCTMFAGDPEVDPGYVCDEWNARGETA